MAEILFEERHHGARFQVVADDLLAEPVDCIVNVAKGDLSSTEGIAAVIAAAAGPRLEAACQRVIAKVGNVPTGRAAITTAGNLPYKAVIHAVGPTLGEGDEENKLVSALKFAFHLADKQGYATLSFPAVGTGIFAIPEPLCVRAYHRAVTEFFDENPKTSLGLIRLCVLEGPVMDEVRRQYQK